MTNYWLQTDIEEVAENLGDAVQAFSGKTVMITGGCGFIGRYFTALFSFLNENGLDKPCRLLILDNFITAGNAGTNFCKLPNCDFIKYDVIDPYTTEADIDFIIHAAGIASPYYYREYPLETLDVSVQGTRNMLELAKEKEARLLFFSSSEIYGDPATSHIPLQESYCGNVSCLGPRSCYDEGKRVGETLCRIYHERFGVETVIVRPFNVYGPGMSETDFRVLPNFASRVKGNQPLYVYGTGNQTRTFTYITDALTGFILALLRGVPGEPYNIGNSKEEISMLDLANRLETILKRKLKINLIVHPDTYPADEPKRRCPNIQKARLQLKYHPNVDLDEGLRRFLTWTDQVYTGEF